MKRSSVIFVVVLLAAAAVVVTGLYFVNKTPPMGYRLTMPKKSFRLPKSLKEISGLATINERIVACVQDEAGSVFFVDVQAGKVLYTTSFGKDGDYEGVACIGQSLWLLRSDGRLLELAMEGRQLVQRRKEKVGLKNREFEGLCYDADGKVLLVAMKERIKGSKSDRDKRRVYRFDPVTGRHVEGSAVKTTIDEMVEEASVAGLELPSGLRARFSSVAVHPDAPFIYVLSAVDGAVFAFAREGGLVDVQQLEKAKMPQPEGMTFMPNGDLVIASESADGKPARIQVFESLRPATR